MKRAARLAWITFGFAVVSVASTAGVLADASPSPSPSTSPSPVATPTPVAPPGYQSALILLSSSSGTVGSVLGVAGTGFPPSTDFAVYLDSPDQGYVATPARLNGGLGPRTDSNGGLNQFVVIPPAGFGAHSMCADTSDPGSSASAAVKVCAQFSVQPQVTSSQAFGSPGTQITLTATGFPAFETVAFYTDTARDGSPADGGVGGPFFGTPGLSADAQGTLVQTITWPHNFSSHKVNPETPGPHMICGDTGYAYSQQPVKVKACVQFLVTGSTAVPTVVLNPSSGSPGTKVLVQGSGFAGRTQISLAVDGRAATNSSCSSVQTDGTGTFQLGLVIQPATYYAGCSLAAMSNGTHKICIDAMSQACADFVFTGATAPASATGSIAQPTGLTRTLAIAGGLVGLLLLAVGGAFFARRATKPKPPPPPG